MNQPINNELHEGDRVWTLDRDLDGDELIKHYGILHRNKEYPDVSEWYIHYDDGLEMAVLEIRLVFKAEE